MDLPDLGGAYCSREILSWRTEGRIGGVTGANGQWERFSLMASV